MALPQNEAVGHLLEALRPHPVVLRASTYGGTVAAGVGSHTALLVFGKADENLSFQGK